jgi:predicted DNA-binding protein (MmcQ/YjbR family)
MTPAAWTKLALSLPETEQRSHFAQPDFRVRGKIFAGLSRDRTQGTLKLAPALQAECRARSTAFTLASGAWGRAGWTHVELAQVTLAEARPLVEHSWRLVAPRALQLAAHEAPTARLPKVARPRAPKPR